jgi:hypothetical protein
MDRRGWKAAPISLSFLADRDRFRSLLALNDLHPHVLAFAERLHAVTFQNGSMNEYVLAAIFRRYEAEALFTVVPFHDAIDFDSRAHVRLATETAACARRTSATHTVAATGSAKSTRTTRRASATTGLFRAVIDGGHFCDLTALHALANLNAQRCAGANSLFADRLQRVRMQKHIAGPIRHFNEAKPFFRVEPFYNGFQFRAARSDRRGRRAARRRSGGGRLPVCRRSTAESEIVIESATAGLVLGTVILSVVHSLTHLQTTECFEGVIGPAIKAGYAGSRFPSPVLTDNRLKRRCTIKGNVFAAQSA